MEYTILSQNIISRKKKVPKINIKSTNFYSGLYFYKAQAKGTDSCAPSSLVQHSIDLITVLHFKLKSNLKYNKSKHKRTRVRCASNFNGQYNLQIYYTHSHSQLKYILYIQEKSCRGKKLKHMANRTV